MSNEDRIPDFTSVDKYIRQAHVERAAYVGGLIAEGGAALARALKRLGTAMERGYAEELDRRAIESDAFLRRSVPRYRV